MLMPIHRDPSLDSLIEAVTSDREAELEWVDLLSQLEYVGCRKIAKAIPYEAVSLETLRHLSEEASHAFLLKAAAEKCGLPERSWREGRLSAAGWKFFQSLDRGVESFAPEAALCYPLVSVAVERRVLALYPAYLERTRLEPVRKALARILAQERRHARQFDARALPADLVAQAGALEERLWAAFASAVLESARLKTQT